jgi:hypothetical protein
MVKHMVQALLGTFLEHSIDGLTAGSRQLILRKFCGEKNTRTNKNHPSSFHYEMQNTVKEEEK